MKFMTLFIIALLTGASAFAQGIDYDCAGFSPEWVLQTRGSRLSFHDQSRTVNSLITESYTAEGATPQFLQLLKARRVLEPLVTVTINAVSACHNDSGASYTHQAVVQVAGTVYFGCCNSVAN